MFQLCVVFLECLLIEIESVDIPIMMSTDEKYFFPTVVAVTSLLKNGNPNTFYDVSVLTPGSFTRENKMQIEYLKENFENCKIDVIDMGKKYEDVGSERLTSPTYYRLELASLFPNLNKCIYLDGDVIVRHDLSEMFNIDLSSFYVAGVCHGETLHGNTASDVMKVTGLPDLNQYVCAGVLIMNLRRIRENDLEKNFSRALEEKGKLILYADQDIINPVCYGKILCLPQKFGYLINFKESGKEKDPLIVHWSGDGFRKPWKRLNALRFDQEFWYYANSTGLSDKEYRKLRERKRRKDKKKK